MLGMLQNAQWLPAGLSTGSAGWEKGGDAAWERLDVAVPLRWEHWDTPSLGWTQWSTHPFWGKGRDPLHFQMKSFNFPPLSIELGIDSPHPLPVINAGHAH